MKRLILFLLTLGPTCYTLSPSVAHGLNAGVQAPEIKLPVRGGGSLSLQELRGKVVYLDFWASWCGPCKHTLPWMKMLQEKYKKQGLEVVAVNIDTQAAAAEALLGPLDPPYTVLFDSEKSAVGQYEPPKMPTSFLIDREGKVTEVFPGFRDGEESEIEGRIQALLLKAQ